MTEQRDHRLAETLATLANTLVDDFDIVDFLGLLAERSTELLDVTAVGVILSDQRGGWRSIAASSESAKLVELFAAQTADGPCLESIHANAPATSADLAVDGRWPRFTRLAVEAGFHAAAALPMRSRHQVIGSLTLLNTAAGDIDPVSIQLGQALADMAVVGLMQQRFADRDDMLVEQLQAALHHRLVIEQAKGVLVECGTLSMEAAFGLLQAYSRGEDQHLSAVARQLVTAETDPELLLTYHQPSSGANQRSAG